MGFRVDNCRSFAKLSYIKDVHYDSKSHYYYKVYENDQEYLPMAMVMRKRNVDHYLNMN